MKYWIIFTAKTEPLTVEKAATITANNSDSVISGKNGLINENYGKNGLNKSSN